MRHYSFHQGELYIQGRAGEREIAARVGGGVGDAIPGRAVEFLADQRLLVAGSVDADGAPRASVLFGDRGLVAAIAERLVVIDRTRVHATADDPIWRNLRPGADVGLLAIELASRRRLRVNGVVSAIASDRIEVAVSESYSNCPKYIQRRLAGREPRASSTGALTVAHGTALDPARSRLLERADTFFVASRHPERGLDVSHRGGEPGFVRLVSPNLLRIPDYRGNSMFNTLGNFAVDDRAGLVVIDFEGGRLLQLGGRVTVHFDEPEDPRQPTGGTGRYWHVQVERWLDLPIVVPLAWELLDRSPHNPASVV